MKQTLMISAGLAAIMTLAACGGGNDSQEDAIEAAAAAHGIDADVTVDDEGEVDQIVINQGASQVGQNLDLPAGFPEDISLPGDWNVMASTPAAGGFSVQALSDDDTASIIADLRARMASNGWSETGDASPTPQMRQIGFEKGDRMANFNIIENGATRMVQLVAIPKP